jgi:Cof subfamily protein (haloacid dehalogenase superfamily)
MKNKLLCFDVDGTLRDNVYHKVSPSTMEALKRLKKNGYKIVISSGRGVDSLKRTGLMEMIDWDGYVCNNGQDVLNAEKQSIFHSALKREAIEETLQIAKRLKYAVMLKSHPRILIGDPNEYVYTSQKYFQSVIPEVGQYQGQEVDAMVVYGPLGYDYEPFMNIEGVTTLPGESTYADLTIAGVTKATGIQILLDLYDLDGYIAFGDSLNDMDMFLHADMSIAMGQGNQRLKDIATYVTSSIDDDGIYQACLHYHLI